MCAECGAAQGCAERGGDRSERVDTNWVLGFMGRIYHSIACSFAGYSCIFGIWPKRKSNIFFSYSMKKKDPTRTQ
jgi:hypothetical protein